MENKCLKKFKKNKQNLLVTADVSNVLKTINNNSGWKANSAKITKNMTLTNKTINPQQTNKFLMNQQDLQKLFHKSKQKIKTEAANYRQYTQWGNKNYKNFVNSVKFLKLDDSYDKLLTGIPVNKEQDFIDFLFDQKQQKQDLTSKFKREYLVGKIVGQGAYASVRVAVYKPLNKKVAIKVYEKNKIKELPRKKSLIRQIKILQMLNHSNLVQIWDVVETNNHVNIIMEYLSGISLNSYLKLQPNNRITQKNSRKIIAALADGLNYLHKKNISHRDIKLQNVIISEDLNPKLIDFGFSTCIQPTKKTKIFCGTPSYMAPEIVQKKQFRGESADIWALGVLSYVMITGCFPFKGSTDQQLYKKINKSQYNKSELLFSKDLSDLINRMLTIDPNERITAQQILNHRWVTLNNPSNMTKKSKRAQTSYDCKKKTTTSSHKSNEKIDQYLKSFKKLNQTCKQNLKMQIKLSRQSPGILNRTCTPSHMNKTSTQRKTLKQVIKNTNEMIKKDEVEQLMKGWKEPTKNKSFPKKQAMNKQCKTNRILNILQNQNRKKYGEYQAKQKQRVY